MTIAAIGAVGAEPSQALKQTAELSNASSGSAKTTGAENFTLGNSIPSSSVEVAQQASSAPSQPGFANSILDGVYTQIDRVSSKVPDTSKAASPIDTYKSKIVSEIDSLSPSETTGPKLEKGDTIQALSKTFDHAIFMAMVNQVVSGVSDTSRTLIKQS